MRKVVAAVALLSLFPLVSQAKEIKLPSLFQMDNVRAMAMLANKGLTVTMKLVPRRAGAYATHTRVDMQWPPATTSVAPGTTVTLFVVNQSKNKVPSPFEKIKLRFDIHTTNSKSGHRVTSSGAGGRTSKTDFFGFHFKGKITGCQPKTLEIVRRFGRTLTRWSKVTSVGVAADGSFDVSGTAQGILESRFLDDKGNLVYYIRSRR